MDERCFLWGARSWALSAIYVNLLLFAEQPARGCYTSCLPWDKDFLDFYVFDKIFQIVATLRRWFNKCQLVTAKDIIRHIKIPPSVFQITVYIYFVTSRTHRKTFRPTLPPAECLQGCFPGVKQPHNDVNPSPPYNGAIPLLPLYAFKAWTGTTAEEK